MEDIRNELQNDLKKVGSLQDWISFNKMITPIIIKILFWIFGILAALGGLFFLVASIIRLDLIGFFIGLLMLVIGPLFVRIYCEILFVLFGIFDELKAINAKTR